MDQIELAASVAKLTADFTPSFGTTEADLDRARLQVARALLTGQTAHDFRSSPAPDGAADISHIQNRLGSDVAGLAQSPVRAFIRTVPTPNSLHPTTPVWARGIHVAHAFGPFQTPVGEPVWIDAFDVVEFTSLTRDSATLVGLFPVNAATSTALAIQLSAGSVWIPAPLLDSSSPPNSYVGFRIKSGIIQVNMPSTRVSTQTLDIPLGAVATLTAVLDPPAAPPLTTGPGVDCTEANIQLPASITIEFDPAGARITALSDSALTVYADTTNLHWSGGKPAYNAPAQQLAVPLTFLPATFTPATVKSTLLTPSGSGGVQAAFWTLPVTVSTPQNLGAAAGAGALVLAIGPGLNQQWIGLPSPVNAIETFLSASPGLIVTTTFGSGSQSGQMFTLWRKSTLDFAPAKQFASFYVSAPGFEWFEINGSATAHTDMPVRADGSRFALTIPTSNLLLFQSPQSFLVYIGLLLKQNNGERVALAIENALLVVDPPAVMVLFGVLTAPNVVNAGNFGLEFGVRGLLPTLPDPYTSTNAAKDIVVSDGPPRGTVIAFVAWQTPDKPDLILRLSLSDSAGGQGIRNERQIGLLDLSTNADLFGVEYSLLKSSAARIQNMAMALPGAVVEVFTLPQISWEPMKSEPAVPGLHAPDDGGPTTIGVETVNLVRVEPAAALRFMESEVAAGANFNADFTLPFGLFARVRAGQFPQTGGTFEITQPAFSTLSGGLQLTLGAPHPEQESASLPGTCEATNPYGIAVFDTDVATIFNDEFLTGTFVTVKDNPPPPPRVPVKRIDFSGYGASMFSDWRESKIEVGVIKAQFDVIVGRTAYEVVKVRSNLCPWAGQVVRTITIERQGAGWVRRTDSGWQPASDGVFDFPPHEKADYIGHIHSGAVQGVVNIRNIREVNGGLITAFGLEYQQVLFDADVWISASFHITHGATVVAGKQLVPSKDIGGYIQLTPGDGPLRNHLAELLKKTGPVGGPVAFVGNVGGPAGPQFTAVSMDASIDQLGSNANLVAALRGSLSLPKDGAWTVAKKDGSGSGSTEPAPLDPKFHLPLVQNEITDPGQWHFADPTDIAQLSAPTIAYGLVQATGTQKMFFARPSVDQAAPATFNLPQPPHLADIGSLLNATGLFPDLGSALQFPSIPPLGVSGTDLEFHPSPFSLIGQKPTPLVDFGGVKILLDYTDGGKVNPDTGNHEPPIPTTVDVDITPGADPSWKITLEPISLVLVSPFGDASDPILRVVGGAKADSKTAPTLTSLDVQYGGALGFVQQVFSKLAEIASSLPGAPFSRLSVNFSQGRLTIQDTFALPTLPLGFGYVTDVSLILGTAIQLSPQSLEFSAGIGSESKPFHWLVSPLSGTGVVQVGVKDGDLAILIEAGIGAGLAIDLAIASGSASIVIALQVNNEIAPFQIKAILTGQASVDVLDGLASASITLSAALGIAPDKLPIPDELTLTASVSVGIHLSVCWLVSVDFDGSWGFSETFQKPGIIPF